MSVESVVNFCAVVAAEKDLQAQLRSALATGDSVSRFVAQCEERGFEATENDVLEVFAAERDIRKRLDDNKFGETRIQHASGDDDSHPGVEGLRTVILSGVWQIGESDAESDSILD